MKSTFKDYLPNFAVRGRDDTRALFGYPRGVGIEVQIDEASALVVVRWTGDVTFADFQRARADVTATPGWSADFAHVLDFTEAALRLSTADVERLAAAKPIFAPGALQILVARAGSVHFGLSRMFEAYSDGKRRVHVVQSMEEAIARIAEERRSSDSR